MSRFALVAALVAQSVGSPPASPPTSPPARAPRALVLYDIQSHETRSRATPPRTTDDPFVTTPSFDVTTLYAAHVSQLSVVDRADGSSTPAARLLASLVEEEARSFDPTVRCVARGSMVAVDSAAGVEGRVRDLLQSASVTSAERAVVVEVRFLMPGPKSAAALKRAGISCDEADGGARLQPTSLTAKELNELLRDDGEVITAPRLTAFSGQPFQIRQVRNVAVVTDWNVVPVEELGNVLEPVFKTLDDGLHADGAALVMARSAERGGDRIALEVEITGLAIGRPIPKEKRLVDGKEVFVQQPTVKQSSLRALFTLAPDQRVIVAGLARPTFGADTAVHPVLLEVVARSIATTEATPVPAPAPTKEH